MSEPVWVAPAFAFGFLAYVWYITIPLTLLAGWGIWKTRSTEPDVSFRPLISVLVWPLTTLLFGMLLVDFDDHRAIEAWFGLTSDVVLLALLFGGLIHLAILARRHRGLSWAILGSVLLFALVSIVSTAGSWIALSGFGRHWR